LCDGLNLHFVQTQDKNICLNKELSDAQKDHAKELANIRKDHKKVLANTRKELEKESLETWKELAQAQQELTQQCVNNSNLQMKYKVLMLQMEMQGGAQGGGIFNGGFGGDGPGMRGMGGPGNQAGPSQGGLLRGYFHCFISFTPQGFFYLPSNCFISFTLQGVFFISLQIPS
jgi:hypothetical protein